MRTVLRPDAVTTEPFAGITLAVEEVDPAVLLGRCVGIIAESPRHVRLLPDVVRHAERTKLFITRPVDVLPMSRLGLGLQLVPPLSRALARLHRWRAVPEPELRRKVTPLGGDVATVVSSAYLRAVQHPTCQVVAWPVAAVSALGVRTADGLEHHVDVLIRA